MKKLIIAAVAVFTVGAASAQDVKFGVKGGLNYATLSGDIAETDGIIGFAVGGFLNVKINEKFAFQPELLYSTQGTAEKSTETISGATINEEGRLELAYMNIPLMFRVNVTEAFTFEAGPQIGFLLSARDAEKETITNSGGSTVIESSDDVKDNLNTTDFGLNFGLGYDLTKNLNAGLRYNVGLNDISKNTDNYTIKNSVFTLAIGYTF